MKTQFYLHRCLVFVASLLLWSSVDAQNRNISGSVTDGKGETLPGVSILIKNTERGTVTDENGAFTLNGVSETSVLVFSYTGFETQEITVGNQSTLTLSMKESMQVLDEMVVVGYGVQRKSHLTGSVGKVNNDNLTQIPVARADQALIGKVAGVQIVTDNAQSGSAPTIQIRGAASITASTQPLIVVDGYPVPTDLSAIDMNDVESIEVLKDAASAAIYGSRGANGVIMVTTKSGKTGKTKISFNTNVGIKDPVRRLDLHDLDSWTAFVMKDNNETLSPQITTAKRFDAKTDPQDVVFQQGLFQNYQVNLRGGNQVAKYFLSGSMVKDKGVVVTNDYTKYSFRANVELDLGKRFDVGLNINPSYAEQNELPLSLHDAIRTIAPWMPLFHNDTTAKVTGKPVGSYVHQRDFDPSRNTFYRNTGLPSVSATGDNNGYTQIYGQNRSNTELRTISSAFVRLKIAEGLSFKSSLNVYTRQQDRYFFQSSWAKTDELIQGITQARAATRGQYRNNRMIDLLNENLLNYKKRSGKHDIDAIAGWTAQNTVINRSEAEAINYASDKIQTLNGGTLSSLATFREQNRLLSALVRVNYALADALLLSLGSRWDGSSRFGADKRWGYFPSASLGWRISQLPGLRNHKTLSDLKLRASYGATGNNNIGNYRAFANVTPVGAVLGATEAVVPGFNVASYGNPELSWERTFSLNGGLDLGLFKDRIRLSVDLYDATTDKLLLYLPIPGATGFDGYWINQGKVQNRGMDLELSLRLIRNKLIDWSVSVVGGTVRNKLLDFGGSQQLISTGDTKRNNYFIAQVGQPLVQFYGYQSAEIVGLQGSNYWPIGVAAERIFVQDIDGNGKIDLNDRTILGTPYPKFTWGLTNNIKVGAFDLSAVLQGSHGASVFNIDPNYYEQQFSSTGANAYLAYPADRQAFARLKTETDYHVQDASFIALRNLNVGYSLPGFAAKKMGLSGLRLYVTTANLFFKMADNYTGLNPEGIASDFADDPLKKGWQKGAYPVARTISFGINADF